MPSKNIVWAARYSGSDYNSFAITVIDDYSEDVCYTHPGILVSDLLNGDGPHKKDNMGKDI